MKLIFFLVAALAAAAYAEKYCEYTSVHTNRLSLSLSLAHTHEGNVNLYVPSPCSTPKNDQKPDVAAEHDLFLLVDAKCLRVAKYCNIHIVPKIRKQHRNIYSRIFSYLFPGTNRTWKRCERALVWSLVCIADIYGGRGRLFCSQNRNGME